MQQTRYAVSLSDIGANVAIRPSLTVYPSRMNRQAYPVWDRTLRLSEVAQALRTFTTNVAAWSYVVKRFCLECEKLGLIPFIGTSSQTNNALLEWHLRRERLELIRFFKLSNLFSKFARPTALTTQTKYEFSGSGFVINVSTRLRSPVNRDVRQWLTAIPQPKFLRNPDKPNLFTKQLTPSTSLRLEWTNDQRIDFSYRIQSKALPVIDRAQSLPSKRDLAAFLDANIWTPLVQTHRVPGLPAFRF